MGSFDERVRRARRAYARGGVAELANSARAKLVGRPATGASATGAGTVQRSTPAPATGAGVDGGAVPMTAPYQIKLLGSLEERWQMIERALPEGVETVLDIGCNLGDIAARCAAAGMWTVGVDIERDLVESAIARHQGARDLAFMQAKVDPGSVRRLPEFDAMLLLSVHHHWLRAHGPDVAGRMLQDLAGRTAKVMIFESSSRRVRFGKHPPDFIDNDESTVTAYHEGYLQEHVGHLFDRIVPLGKTPCVGEREPYRWSWALYR